jgi:hypothetical protein
MFFTASFCGFGWWRHDVQKHTPPPAHIVDVIDASNSMRPDCLDDTKAIRGAMRSAGVRRGSTLTLIRTGDPSTKQEPQLVFQESIPAGAAMGPFSGGKKAKDVRDAFFARVQSACLGIRQTKRSPVVKAVRRGLAHLKSLGCPHKAGCVLIVHSDLQDNDELTPANKKSDTAQPLLDNAGINVVLCGFTATVEDGATANTDALLAMWQGLFLEPVKVAPFCGEGAFSNQSRVHNERRLMGLTINAHSGGQQHGFGREPTDLFDPDQPLYYFSESDFWSRRNSWEGTLVTASPGGGKTANIGRNLAHSLVRDPHSGGLVLVAKSEEIHNWVNIAKACGREKDLLIFNAESGHCFDPLYYEWNRPGRGAGDLETIIDLFSTLMSIGKKEVGHGHDPFWERGNEQLIRNVIKLLDLASERVSIANIDRAIKSLPTRPGEHEEEGWQKESYCASLINAIRERKDSLSSEQWGDLDFATQYVFKKWPAFDERPRSSLEMTWSGMADKFLFNPFNRLFCSGKCTFVPEMTTHQNRIVVVDFPMLEYGHETGRLINVLVKLIFQRAWLRRNLAESANPVFLWQDEFQYFVHRRDNFFQQTCRSARVANVCITQNILNLSEELGEQQPGSKTKSFLGNLALKIFAQQNDPDTQTYGADLIGKEWRYIDNFNASANADTGSVGGAMQLVHRVDPSEFSRLTKPDGKQPLCEAIVYQGGKAFNATVTRENPRGRNYLTVAFSRDI